MTPIEALHIIDTYCIPSAYPHTEAWEQVQEIKKAYNVLSEVVKQYYFKEKIWQKNYVV